MATKEEVENQVDKKESLFWLWFAFGVITLIWLVAPFSFMFLASFIANEPATISNIAEYGDSFGGINSLFSGLAFAGMIYAIILQRNELTLTRNELTASKKAQQESAKAQQDSEKAFRKQIQEMNNASKLNAYIYMVKHYKGLYGKSKEDLDSIQYTITQVEEQINNHTKWLNKYQNLHNNESHKLQEIHLHNTKLDNAKTLLKESKITIEDIKELRNRYKELLETYETKIDTLLTELEQQEP